MTDATTEPTNGAPKRTRTRKAPYVRVAMQLTDGTWQFYESVRMMRGDTALQAIVFSGGQDVIDQANTCVKTMAGTVRIEAATTNDDDVSGD